MRIWYGPNRPNWLWCDMPMDADCVQTKGDMMGPFVEPIDEVKEWCKERDITWDCVEVAGDRLYCRFWMPDGKTHMLFKLTWAG